MILKDSPALFLRHEKHAAPPKGLLTGYTKHPLLLLCRRYQISQLSNFAGVAKLADATDVRRLYQTRQLNISRRLAIRSESSLTISGFTSRAIGMTYCSVSFRYLTIFSSV